MTPPTYPTDAGFDRWYGHSVWQLGEDGDLLVQGHGRRALAALNAYLRHHYGRGQTDVANPPAREGHAVFTWECGCTRHDHEAGHPRGAEQFPPGHDLSREGDVVDGKVETDCDCDDPGLPPCGDEWAWIARPIAEGPTSLPVLWVRT